MAAGPDPSELPGFLGKGGLALYLAELRTRPGSPPTLPVKRALQALQSVGLSVADGLALPGAKSTLRFGGKPGMGVSPHFDMVRHRKPSCGHCSGCCSVRCSSTVRAN